MANSKDKTQPKLTKETGDKNLVIAIDPGFDGIKIVINKLKLHVPFNVIEVTNDFASYNIKRRDDNYIITKTKDRIFITGTAARTALLSPEKRKKLKNEMDQFYSTARFENEKFYFAIKSIIVYAMYKLENSEYSDGFKISEIADWKVKVGLALPHDLLDLYMDKVSEDLRAQYDLEVTIGGNEPLNVKYEIDEIFFNSQGVCPLINEIADDEGNDIDGVGLYNHLPAVIINAGYKSVEMMCLERDESITLSESNVDFAMKNLNEILTADIKQYNSDFYDFMVEEYIKTGQPLRYLDKDGKMQSIDIAEIRVTKKDEMLYRFIEYLKKKFNNFLDTNYILVAGGTGNVYYDILLEHVSSYAAHLKDRTVLPKGTFNGTVVEPIFAVAVGLYKDMIGQINSND